MRRVWLAFAPRFASCTRAPTGGLVVEGGTWEAGAALDDGPGV